VEDCSSHSDGNVDEPVDFSYQLAQAVERTSELIGMADCSEKFIFVNQSFSQVLGYTREEVLGKHFRILISPENPATFLSDFTARMYTPGGWQGDCLLRRRDGVDILVSLSVGAIKDKHGRVIGSFGIGHDITERVQKEKALQEAHQRLNVALVESERAARDAANLSELMDILQSCLTLEEAYKIIQSALQTALPSPSGALFITSASRNIVEVEASWGTPLSSSKTFRPDDCWALRRGKVHKVKSPHSPLRCAHVSEDSSVRYLCVPLVAQGETLGVLYLEGPSEAGDCSSEAIEEQMDLLTRRAVLVGERISLAIANLRLREILRGQSIRDPLTGLFNRRYMEESLERELSRASRSGASVALLMIDIDHFKRFNDTFGHQAGDKLLRSLGDFLNQRTRGQDVPCRYGGEEFAVILSNATLDAARRRAELLHEGLTNLSVEHAGQVLERITISIGVAATPGHGTTALELLHAADQGLYRAKTEGRDRAVVA
jgi:diguanylate cyclase (GGDEF)-like protein/PAS domain S-box-containing protein